MSDIFRIQSLFFIKVSDANVVLIPNCKSGSMVTIATYWTENFHFDVTGIVIQDEVTVFKRCINW
jgi:hypothetical protein